MQRTFPMTQMKKNTTAWVERLNCSGSMRRRLQDIGLIEGTRVECLFRRVKGGPTAYFRRLRPETENNKLLFLQKESPDDLLVAIGGNPNVGKSTVFNALTGLRQHTGNWAGKTVSTACGECRRFGKRYILTDIPGTYSLFAHSAEEEVARDFLLWWG